MSELKYLMIISILIINYFDGSKARFGFISRYEFFNWGIHMDMLKYSGKRAANDSVLWVYYHDGTIGVVERTIEKELLKCEFLFVNNGNTETIAKSLIPSASSATEITLDEILSLMNDCEIVDKRNNPAKEFPTFLNFIFAFLFAVTPMSMTVGIAPVCSTGHICVENIFYSLTIDDTKLLFMGINKLFPRIYSLEIRDKGTNWCGTNNIAKNYNDLGFNSETDRCCRLHDVCPTKLIPNESKYNITNNSYIVVSHCSCDDALFSCLRDANTFMSHLIGVIFFKMLKMPCLAYENGRYSFRGPKRGF